MFTRSSRSVLCSNRQARWALRAGEELIVPTATVMDEKDFKKHLQELAHGHHHPEQHDWPEKGPVRTTDEPVRTDGGKAKKSSVRKAKRRAK